MADGLQEGWVLSFRYSLVRRMAQQIPTVIFPSMNDELYRRALAFVPAAWPHIVKDGNPTRHFDELRALPIQTKWAINVDEDCFLINPGAILELIGRMEREGFDTAGIQDGSSHLRNHNPTIFNPFFFVFDVQKVRNSSKTCIDPAKESQHYAELVRFHHLPYQYDNFEPYYPFFVDLLHSGLKPLYLANREFKEFPDDGTQLGKPSIVLDDAGRELAIHSWYSRLYHEPVVKGRIQRCIDHAAASPFSVRPGKAVQPVTVLIPARNAAATLLETLLSLENQTFKQFSVLLVNDASSDQTCEIAAQFQSRLNLSILNLATNAGVAGAINQGLAQIESPYIARIDADDIALSNRLEVQVQFLEANPEIDVCSTWMETFSGHPDFSGGIARKPLLDGDIKTALIQYCSISHGASMFRRTFFEDVGVFDTRLDFAEDYDMWCRSALLGKKFANIGQPLTRYRQHEQQVGKQKRQLQYERDLKIKRKYLEALLNGTPVGHLPEFLHLLNEFSNKAIAAQVLRDCLPVIAQLSQRVPNKALFWQIISNCIDRHLLQTVN